MNAGALGTMNRKQPLLGSHSGSPRTLRDVQRKILFAIAERECTLVQLRRQFEALPNHRRMLQGPRLTAWVATLVSGGYMTAPIGKKLKLTPAGRQAAEILGDELGVPIRAKAKRAAR